MSGGGGMWAATRGVHDTCFFEREVDALRYAVDNKMDAVKFVRFGNRLADELGKDEEDALIVEFSDERGLWLFNIYFEPEFAKDLYSAAEAVGLGVAAFILDSLRKAAGL